MLLFVNVRRGEPPYPFLLSFFLFFLFSDAPQRSPTTYRAAVTSIAISCVN